MPPSNYDRSQENRISGDRYPSPHPNDRFLREDRHAQRARALRRKRAKRKRLIRLGIFLLLVCIFIFGAVKLIQYISSSRATQKTNDALQNLYENAQHATPIAELPSEYIPDDPIPLSTQEAAMQSATPIPMLLSEYQDLKGNVLPEMMALYGENNDLVAWIKIPGAVNLPIVYRDNTYYLTHDFYGRDSSAGTLFLDVNSPLTPATQNLVIHGHNMHDGSMFGRLSHYRSADYILDHGIIHLTTLSKKESYAVFAVVVSSADPESERYIPFTAYPTFASAAQFYAYMDLLFSRSVHDIPLDVSPADAILTLSTCLEEDRVLVICRRLREGETEEAIRAQYLAMQNR